MAYTNQNGKKLLSLSPYILYIAELYYILWLQEDEVKLEAGLMNLFDKLFITAQWCMLI